MLIIKKKEIQVWLSCMLRPKITHVVSVKLKIRIADMSRLTKTWRLHLQS
jgi:hypothetical protein